MMDYAGYFDETGLRSPYYRVSCKAVVRDNAGRVLVVADATDTFELPGGGWEHGESFETALRREFQEEVGVELKSAGKLLFTYYGHGRWPHVLLRIVAEATLKNHDFALDDNEVTEARFVDREEFLSLNWCDIDRGIIAYVDYIWPQVEKTR